MVTSAPCMKVKRMNKAQMRPRNSASDDELVDVLTAISVISMRLARKFFDRNLKFYLKRGLNMSGLYNSEAD
jgi:hypothetical protein